MRLTPTLITLPALALAICWTGLAEDCIIVATAGQSDAAPRRLSEEEINELLRAAQAQFSSPRPPVPAPPPPPGPRAEIRFERPGACAKGIHPVLTTGSRSLRAAVADNQREAFRRVEKSFQEHLDWLEEEGPAAATLDYTEEWSVSCLRESLVSLSCEGMSYSGGVHGNLFFMTRTFWDDGQGARELSLGDLFRPGIPWLEPISRLVLRELRDEGATAVIDGVVASLDERALANWRLTPLAIEFLFPPYEVGCFADGSFAVHLFYEDVREYLDPNGPVAGLLR